MRVVHLGSRSETLKTHDPLDPRQIAQVSTCVGQVDVVQGVKMFSDDQDKLDREVGDGAFGLHYRVEIVMSYGCSYNRRSRTNSSKRKDA